MKSEVCVNDAGKFSNAGKNNNQEKFKVNDCVFFEVVKKKI